MATRIISLCAWIITCGLLAGAACPAPNHSSLLGVHGSADPPTTGLDIIQAAGVKWVRVQTRWRQIETADDVYNWTELDTRVMNAARPGFSIVLYFQGTPAWATANGNGAANDPPTAANKDKFGDFVRDVMLHRLPGNTQVDPWPGGRQVGEVVARYELWNEPNLNEFWSSTRDVWKDRILRPGIAAINQLKIDPPGFSPAAVLAPSTYINYDKGVGVDLGNWTSGYLCDIYDVSVHTYGSRATQLQEMQDVNNWCNNPNNCCLGFEVTEAGFDSFAPCEQDSCDPYPGPALLATQNKCVNLGYCYGNFIFNLYDVSPGVGLVNSSYQVRDRLCHLEANYGTPLAVAEPCPCSAGKPGCANAE
jgi:hypothetical protein